MATSAATMQGAAALLPIREEIAIFRGPPALDGTPSYTLHDPTRNRFYRIGWPEFEIISRWNGSTAQALVDRVNDETTLHIEPEEVDELRRFLLSSDLLRVTTPQGTTYLVEQGGATAQQLGAMAAAQLSLHAHSLVAAGPLSHRDLSVCEMALQPWRRDDDRGDRTGRALSRRPPVGRLCRYLRRHVHDRRERSGSR